tara:strand:+ start:571 stop:693 length:123 start_codon:yes stop_codon:yes gene_type:complete
MDVHVMIGLHPANDHDASQEFWKGVVEISSTNYAIFADGR